MVRGKVVYVISLSVSEVRFLHCNYNIKDHPIPSQFYAEMLQWWAEFRDEFSTEKYWQSIIWNNKDIRINNAPVYYKTAFFESGIICVNDLLFILKKQQQQQ